MSQAKHEELNQAHHDKLGPDVYENASKFNLQIATKGPAVLYALSKAGEQVTNSHIVTGVGGLVVGSLNFFGNRYFRNKGDDSANSYMGQMIGGVQGTAGMLLIMLEATATVYGEADPHSSLSSMIQTSTSALSLTLAGLILVNSFLYGDGAKVSVASRPKMD